MTTIITLDAVEKRSFTMPVVYKAGDLDVDLPDTRVARNGDIRVTKNGDTRIAHKFVTLGRKQILQAEKRSFTMPVVVVDG